MWVDGEPENQGNMQEVAMSGLINVLYISQMLLYPVFEMLNGFSYLSTYVADKDISVGRPSTLMTADSSLLQMF